MKNIVDGYSKRKDSGQTKENNEFLRVKHYFESDPSKKLLTYFSVNSV